jgi:predicted RNase H-like nuclease (RuvC/YqgF family)
MNKSVNLTIRILGIALAIAACVFAYLLKGKVDAGMKNTEWTVADPEIAAPKQFEKRMEVIGSKLKNLVEEKRGKIAELEGIKKDLEADVADKKTKIEGLNAKVEGLEGNVAELTRKRDELTSQLTDVTSKKDSLTAELNSIKQELVREKEKTASLFTKEQLDAEIAKTTKAEESRNSVVQLYAQLYNSFLSSTGTKPSYPRDPLSQPSVNSLQAEFAPETIKTRIVRVDTDSGLVCFSVGELNSIKPQSVFKVQINGAEVGKVRVESVQTAQCIAQILVDSDSNQFSDGGVVTLEPISGKLANN